MPALIDLTGKRFGRLTVAWPAGIRNRDNFWFCFCDCENSRAISSMNLRTGDTKSCGCLRKEVTTRRMLKHGHNRKKHVTVEYNAWTHMIQRCTNKKNKNYFDYGGRGIRVCSRWRKFENFLADVGRRPKGKTLDRFPNTSGNYKPGNVRWATPKEQANNRRKRKRRTKVP